MNLEFFFSCFFIYICIFENLSSDIKKDIFESTYRESRQETTELKNAS